MNPQGTAELSGAERINAERARQIDGEDYADAREDIPMLVAEVRRLREREAKLRELHKPHGIYDECGHQHTEEDEILGIVDAGDAGLSCKKMYDVCTVCCDVADDGCQGETCVCDHDHSTDLPICKTREILDA